MIVSHANKNQSKPEPELYRVFGPFGHGLEAATESRETALRVLRRMRALDRALGATGTNASCVQVRGCRINPSRLEDDQ